MVAFQSDRIVHFAIIAYLIALSDNLFKPLALIPGSKANSSEKIRQRVLVLA